MEPHSDVNNRIYSDTIEIPDVHDQQEEPLLSQEPISVDLYSPTSSNSRLSRLKHMLSKRSIKKLVYKWRWPIGFFILSIFMGLLMWAYKKELFEGLEALSFRLKDMGYSGYILMATLIFSSAFPPILGYGTYQTLSGFTFGFQIGFPISYLSALSGAIVCFSLSRMFLKARVTRMLAKYPNLEAVVRAVEKKGFKLFLLIRLSPYPFNLLNVLFAATEISLFHFAAGTAITLLKIALHVYIGANLTSFAKHILGEEEDMTPEEIWAEKVKTYAVIIGSIISFLVMFYIYRVAQAAVREANLENSDTYFNNHDEERDIELSHGFLDDDDEDESEHELEPVVTAQPTTKLLVTEPSPRESASLDEWDAWGDDDSSEEEHPIITRKFKHGDVLGKDD